MVVVGAGPVGLAAALDLAGRGRRCVLLDDDQTVSTGSRAICWSKRTLEIMDRLGVGTPLVNKGVTWQLGKVFHRDRLVYTFDLQPEPAHRMPAFVNLQQYYFEQFAIERAQALGVDLRFRNRVTDLEEHGTFVRLRIETPDGAYMIDADWVVACDGTRSRVREAFGLPFQGQVFRDHFLITDVVMEADFSSERRFWFDPPFHPGQSALLHRQADNVWRIDLQLGWDAVPEIEKQPERVMPRIRAMLGPDQPFEVEWISLYTFQCRRIENFRHGRVLFAGDAAHQVSPFGARGGNGGIQDADNLVWKLDLVLAGQAPEALLDSYDLERGYATDENILNSTRSTDFITPKGPTSKAFRDAVLGMAEDHPFARRFVNSGRLSVPAILEHSPLGTADADDFEGAMMPGAVCADAPVSAGWLLAQTGGGFRGLYFADSASDIAGDTTSAFDALARDPVPVDVLVVTRNPADDGAGAQVVHDVDGHAFARYDATPGTFHLVRPDQHVAGRWRRFDPEACRKAVARATGHELEEGGHAR